MTTTQLGRLAVPDDRRDAVHIAIAPVEAAENVKPGQRVGLDAMGRIVSREPHVGIVDPFLSRDVKEGERCWLALHPNTITSLRHEWFHPSFQQEAAMDDLRVVAERVAHICGKTYEALMDDARYFAESAKRSQWPDHIMDNSERYKDVETEDWEKFWQHFERVTGERPKDENWAPYTCSC